ncbi:hypothetical protein U9M48_001473 [Paspalum notatum var. saurae]|uniref:DUF4220 domain-containing protein n=1 Tax=Paspalum notatum var. saurae TaxID=547442 RepID=A0AAQ3PNN6_PASNO
MGMPRPINEVDMIEAEDFLIKVLEEFKSRVAYHLELQHAKELWDAWEMHCLILLSLSLQVFLFLTADLRRRSASCVVRTVLWLAYLLADIVAIFVLGHLAVHEQGPSHELMLFWAPFVLVHLGGQDNITAFSKQDNELWLRHLLNLVTQTTVAVYVVSKSSWPDARIRAAMMLMFLSGFLKYAGRTYCLYSSCPTTLRAASLDSLSDKVRRLRKINAQSAGGIDLTTVFERMFDGDKCWEDISEQQFRLRQADDIMSVDAPVNNVAAIETMATVWEVLERFKSSPDRHMAYQYISYLLVQSYRFLYTKEPLFIMLINVVSNIPNCIERWYPLVHGIFLFVLACPLFHDISALIALVLFADAEKEGHYSRVDVTVTYILLVGAIVLDLLPALTSIVSYARKPFRPRTVAKFVHLCAISCIDPPGWLARKQWSEELAQYSMVQRYTAGSTQGYSASAWMVSFAKWTGRHLGSSASAWCVEFFEVTRTPVTDHLKLVVIDKLFLQASTQEWDFASSRGERAIRKWMGMDRNQVPEPGQSGYALHKSVSSTVDFPTSVLICHIATDICYFSDDGKGCGTEPNELKKKKSRELSYYIMYLVFKCNVMLTTNSRFVHQRTHGELTKFLLAQQSPHITIDEKKAIGQVFEGMMKQEYDVAWQAQGRKNEIYANKDDATTSNRIKEFQQTMDEALGSVMPRAYAVAQELITINNEDERWDLISDLWLEMLFYTAPRCGAAFHYEHLSTGGEFITHVLLLMRNLGPFLPMPGA